VGCFEDGTTDSCFQVWAFTLVKASEGKFRSSDDDLPSYDRAVEEFHDGAAQGSPVNKGAIELYKDLGYQFVGELEDEQLVGY
jgi:hypothetical protein